MLTNCRALGLGGSVLVAAGGLAAGALPREGFDVLRRHPGWGVVVAYTGLVLLITPGGASAGSCPTCRRAT